MSKCQCHKLVSTVHSLYNLASRFRRSLNKLTNFDILKIQPKNNRLQYEASGIAAEFVGFIPHNLVLWCIVLG